MSICIIHVSDIFVLKITKLDLAEKRGELPIWRFRSFPQHNINEEIFFTNIFMLHKEVKICHIKKYNLLLHLLKFEPC